MATFWNHNLDISFIGKLWIDGPNIIILKSLNRPQNPDMTILFLIVYIFYNKSDSLFDKMIRTNVFIHLNKLSKSLSEIHARLLDYISIQLIFLSLKQCLDIPMKNQIKVISFLSPFWYHYHYILPWS